MNTKASFGLWGLLAVIVAGLYVFGGNGEKQKAVTQLTQVEQQIASLEKDLDSGSLRNAAILKTYAEQVKKQKPELAALLETLEKDATSSGPAMQRLKDRLEKAKNNPDSIGGTDAVLAELESLKGASNPAIFNEALVDSINVIADLSGGTFSRIQAPAQSADTLPATQLIGNPQYGQWKQNNGMTIWEWYGAYALFRDLLGGRNYTYSDWRANPPSSFYNTQGRNFFANPREKQGIANDNNKRTKSYGYGESSRRSSSYSNSRSSSGDSGYAAPKRRASSYSSFGSGRSARRSSSFRRR